LEKVFKVEKLPNSHTRARIAELLGMTPKKVKVWFQNKRAKIKRENQGGVDVKMADDQDELLSPQIEKQEKKKETNKYNLQPNINEERER